MTAATQEQPVQLVSVNTAPDRAKKVIGAVIEQVKEKYAIEHAGNSESEWPFIITADTLANSCLSSYRGRRASAALDSASSGDPGEHNLNLDESSSLLTLRGLTVLRVHGEQIASVGSKETGLCLTSRPQWTPEQQEEIQSIARKAIPGIKTHAIPTGLQVKVGPEGIVKYLVERIDEIMAEP